MKLGERWTNACLFLILMPLIYSPVYALDPLYERNGLAYLLVSDENHNQDPLDGVYQVNRTPTGAPVKLFYPGLTYGIGVDLNLNLHTFSEKVGNEWKVATEPQIKVVNYKQTPGYYTGAAWWHRCINQVNGATRIPGSEGHFPCEAHLHPPGSWEILDPAVNGDPGLKKLRIPANTWYHCADPASIGWPAPAGGWYSTHETIGHPYQNPNPNAATARSWKMYRDLEKRLYHEYFRHTWRPGDGPGTPPANRKVAESFEVDITRYIRNGCFDGCGINQSQVPLPAEMWHCSMIFNRMAKSYFYARKIGTVEAYLDIEGVRYPTYPVIGTMFDLTAVDIGVSMKSATDDYVYILGKRVADEWLYSYYGIRFSVNYGMGVVSDQWWMKGGTVFIYDREAGTIYEFDRDEGLPTQPNDPLMASKTVKITPHSGMGSDLNDIGADGFGNLFYTKTNRVPPSPRDFNFSMRTGVTWSNPSGGIRPGVVQYRQNIYKTVFKKEVSGAVSNEGNLLIGYCDYHQNIQYRPYTPTSNLNETSFWEVLGEPYLVYSSIGNASRTELAVVNVATPPKVEGEKIAKLDICGPFGESSPGVYDTPCDPASLTPTVSYKFEIENSPLHNGKINQRTSTSPDVDPRYRRIDRHPFNGFIGGFVSTLKILGNDRFEPVKYHWRVYQTVDATNNPVSPRRLIYQRGEDGNYYRDYIFISLDSGEYDIEVTCQYQWYDNDLLGYGSTVGSLPLVLKPSASTYDSGVAIDGTPVAKMHVKVHGITPPVSTVANVRIRRFNGRNWVDKDVTEGASIGNYFVVGQKSNQRWQVDDPSASQLVKALRQATPPNPGDPYLRPGSLEWVDNQVQAVWSTKILKPQTPLVDGEYYSPGTISFIGSTKHQDLPTEPINSDNFFEMKTGPSANDALQDEWKNAFAIPSDPGLYEFRCKAERKFVWETVPIIYEVGPGGNLIARPGDPVPRSSKVTIEGVARVLVLDEEPPRLAEAYADFPYLYAETGGKISGTILGSNPNPAFVTFFIPDNNPLAWLTWTRTAGKHNRTHVQGVLNYECSGPTSDSLGSTSVLIASYTVIASGVRSLILAAVPRTALDETMPIHKAIRLKNPLAGGIGPFSPDQVETDPLEIGLQSIRDTSQNLATATPRQSTGQILLVDVIPPILSFRITDEKYAQTRYIPDSADFSRATHYVYAGRLDTWIGAPTPTNLGTLWVDGTAIGPVLVRLTPDAEPLEVDTPITFSMHGLDNITASDALTFDEFSMTRVDPAGPSESLTAPLHRKIFRMDTGGTMERWELQGRVADKALGLPSALQEPYAPSTTYPLSRQSRRIQNAPFEIRNTTVEVRVIDKSGR